MTAPAAAPAAPDAVYQWRVINTRRTAASILGASLILVSVTADLVTDPRNAADPGRAAIVGRARR